eukprot:CAMPEP_0178936774 /NCGR_PEP_ID=MMETSP0786-20121207/25372_1 /TAXON_ID=186022 /ORGANISM="Thalassionema frauenfeldii, Strain CCMP 1798" /LENGTH=44 /DNA_ID= /DNA_START= /DNA_END= /DNA_ORIENTATION=
MAVSPEEAAFRSWVSNKSPNKEKAMGTLPLIKLPLSKRNINRAV